MKSKRRSQTASGLRGKIKRRGSRWKKLRRKARRTKVATEPASHKETNISPFKTEGKPVRVASSRQSPEITSIKSITPPFTTTTS
jgi:hypothetical protein